MKSPFSDMVHGEGTDCNSCNRDHENEVDEVKDITQEVVSEVSKLTTIPEELIKHVMHAVRLVTLSTIYKEVYTSSKMGSYSMDNILIDIEDQLIATTGVTDEMFNQVCKTVTDGMDYLGSSIIRRFDDNLIKDYMEDSLIGMEDE